MIKSGQIDTFREQYPALKNKIYLNFGAQGVMARQALDAIACSYEHVQKEGPLSSAMFKWISEELSLTRRVLAEELNCAERSIAITQSVTEGINIVLWGIDWQRGDHLLTTDCEHVGIDAAVAQLSRSRQVHIDRVCVLDGNDEELAVRVSTALTPRTRLCLVSHVLWNTGRIMPIAAIAGVCARQGVKMLVDGAQSAGVLPLDVPASGADFYAVTGHKWLGGPEGVGALYVKEDLLTVLEPTFVGWRGLMGDPDALPSAERFEVSTAPFPLLAGLREAISVHRTWGSAEKRYSRIRQNVGHLKEKLAKLTNVGLIAGSKQCSGLVSFRLTGIKHAEVVRALERRSIVVRAIPQPDCLRASVHYFNTREELDALCAALTNILR